MKSKITKIQKVLMKGITVFIAGIMAITPIVYATTSLDDSYLESSWWEQLLYGTIGSTVKEIEEYFNLGKTTLYITNETQLRAFAEYVNNGNDCSGKEIILLNDIKVDKSNEWVPIGNQNNSFKGTFDGNSHTISGINFTGNVQSNVGLFGYAENAKIKNVIISDTEFNIPYDSTKDVILADDNSLYVDNMNYIYTCQNLGGVAGYIDSTTIENCEIKENVYINGLAYVGGIVGYNNNGTIKNCINNSNVIGFARVGGIAGCNYKGDISKSANNGIINATTIVGGIVGENIGSVNSTKDKVDFSANTVAKIIGCENNGDINSAIGYVGGICGSSVYDSIIQSSINNGRVSSSEGISQVNINGNKIEYDTNNVGGIAGYVSGALNVNKKGYAAVDACINNGSVVGYCDVGGIIGQLLGIGKGNSIVTNNINYSLEVKGVSAKDTGFLIGDVGTINDKDITEAHAYLANNLYVLTDKEVANVTAPVKIEENKYNYNGDKYVLDGDATYNKFLAVDSIDSNQSTEKYILGYGNFDSTDRWSYIEGNSTKVIYKNGENYTILYSEITERGNNERDYFTIKLTPSDMSAASNELYNMFKTSADMSAGENYEWPAKDTEVTNEQGEKTSVSIDGAKVVSSNETAFKVEGNKWTLKNGLNNETNKEYVVDSTTGTTVTYDISKNGKAISENEYLKAGDVLKVTAKFNKYLASTYGPLTAITNAPVLKIKDSIEMKAGNVNATTLNYTTEIEYTYTIQDGEEFDITSLNLSKISGIYAVGSDYDTVHPTISTTSVSANISNIIVDAKKPRINTKIYVENELAAGRYTAGKEIIIETTTDEKIKGTYTTPEIKVSFDKNGTIEVGRYNSGYAKCTSAVINLDGTTTWRYSYIIQEFDEGYVSVAYTGGKIEDLAGNSSDLRQTISVRDIYADTTAPTVKIIASDKTDKTYDIDNDGYTTAYDAILIARYVAKLNTDPHTERIKQMGDVNGDNIINIGDAVVIIRYVEDNKYVYNTNADKIYYSINFSEKVEGFTKEDITVNNGNIVEFEEIDKGLIYVIGVENSVADGNEGIVQVIIEEGVCKDLAAINNIRQESNITIDKVRPTFTSYEIKEESGKIIIETVFSEELSSALKLRPNITIGGKTPRGTWEHEEIYDNNKVRFVYNKDGADGGKVEVSLVGTVKDTAGNDSEKLNIQIENDIILTQTVIKHGNDIYSFYKNDEAINDFTNPWYFVKGDTITVKKKTYDENGITSYSYTVERKINLTHMEYMNLNEPSAGETVGTATFSTTETPGSVKIEEANIWFDTIAPTIKLTSYVENKNENNRYTNGKEIILIFTTSEEIQEGKGIPEINVRFSESGLGKYNYQGENATTGNAVLVETIKNEDKTVSFRYRYIVEEGDEGQLQVEYLSGKVFDLAGNETDVVNLYVAKQPTSSYIEAKEFDSVEIENIKFYKNSSCTEEINPIADTDQTGNMYIKVELNQRLYTDIKTLVNRATAPSLYLNDDIETEIQSVNNGKTIIYKYDKETVNCLTKVDYITLKNENSILYNEKELVANAEGIAKGKKYTEDINNFNLDPLCVSSSIELNDIYADTTAPTVEISVKKVEDNTKTDVNNNITNADKLEYTFTWSEKVTGFTDEDITVNKGARGILSDVIENEDGTYSYTMDITTNIENGNVGDIQVIVEQDACQDLVAHSNVRTESVIRVDKVAPIFVSLEAYANSAIGLNAEVDTLKEYYKEEDIVTIVATFSENVENSTAPILNLQFSESGNAKGSVTPREKNGNKITYTYTITKEDMGTISVKGFSGKLVDAAGNETIVSKRELDGDTIIADTTAPKLSELKVISTKEANKSGDSITIEAVYNEEIYALITKEDGTKEIVNILDENNAPELDISFGGVAAKGNMTAKYATKEDGTADKTRIIYTYIVKGEEAEGDNGDLVINKLKDSANSQVCDIAGNTSDNTTDNKETNDVYADTTRPSVTNIIAEGDGIEHNDIEFYKSGTTVNVTVESDDIIATDVIPVYYAFKETQPTDEEYKVDKEGHLNTDNSNIYNFTINVEDGENGFLWVKVLDEAFTDEAGNWNKLYGGKVEEIYADTTDPYLATNTDGKAEWKIEKNTNKDGIITGITVTGIFNEKVFSMSGNELISLKDIPTLGIFVNNELKKKAEQPKVDIRKNEETILDDQTILTYTVNITDIDTKGNISVNFIDGTVYDRAGNQMSIDLIEGDVTSPIFKDIKFVTPNDFYKAGEVIEIIARFEEETKLTDIPKLKIKIGDSVKEITAETYNKDDIENTETIKVARYKYPITEEDTGALNIISLIGKVSDGVRPREISQVYIDVNEDDIDDVNGKAEELLNSDGLQYENNDEEYKNVIVDNKKPYITSVEAIVKEKTDPNTDRIIAKYTKKDEKDSITEVGKTNVNEIEYVITFSEPIEYIDESLIKLYNAEKEEIIYHYINKYKHYDKITIKARTTIEGVQSLIISDNAIEDRAGNANVLERFNMVTTDFTKPTVRFISEYNGGVYVLPTNVEKIEIRPNVEINEDIAWIGYKWAKFVDGEWKDIQESYTEVNNYTSASDIAIGTQTFGEGEYKLFIKVQDLAGNVYETKEGVQYKIVESKITFEPNTTEDTNQDVIVKVTFEEGLTDNRKVMFKPQDETKSQELSINEEGKYIIDAYSNGNGTIYVEATDKVGNKVYNELSITNIDIEKPIVELGLNGANLVIGTGKEKEGATVKTTINVNEPVIIEYSWEYKDDSATVETNWVTSKEYKTTQETECSTGAGVSYLNVKATDKAGNVTEFKSEPFNVANSNIIKDEEGNVIFTPAKENTITFTREQQFVYVAFGENLSENREITFTNKDDGDLRYGYAQVLKPTTVTAKASDVCGNTVIATYVVESVKGPEFDVIGNPKDWTNQNVKLEVSCYETLSALTVNGKDILSKEDELRSNYEVSQNGDYEFVATDTYGNVSKKTITVSKIDKSAPVISKVENKGKEITITANDGEGSGIAGYAISTTTELPAEWSKSNVIKTTEDGTFYVWVKDNVGNVVRAENTITVDTTAPTIAFNYSSLTATVDSSIGATIQTNEDAVISYSWDNKNWTTSEDYLTSVNTTHTPTKAGTYTLYAKATDKSGNISGIKTLEFTVINRVEDIKVPEIIFEDLPTIQVDGVKYVKVPEDMTAEILTSKMNQEALCGTTPEYINLTDNKDLKTGSKITINGKIKYIIAVNGDVNCDGRVTFIDIIKANGIRISNREDTLPREQLLAADINNTNRIEFRDIISINAIRINSDN